MKERHLQDSEAARLQHPTDFFHCQDVVSDMFQNVVAEYGIKGVIIEGHCVDIHLHFCQRRLEVSGGVIVPVELFKPRNEARFRCDMQNWLFSLKEGCLFLQVQPDQPVSFKRQTIGAKGIGTRVNPSVREKSPETVCADRACYALAPEKESRQL